MAGTPREGLLFASLPTGLLENDSRIDKLLDAQGWRGFGVYMYLTLRAFGSHGYYADWRFADCATTARKMGGGMGAGQVEEAMRCCLQVGLFDEGLLVRWGALTSKDIQTAYAAAATKARRRPRIHSELWLLDDPPANGLLLHGQIGDNCSKDKHDRSKDGQNCGKNETVKYGMCNVIPTTTTTAGMLDSSGGGSGGGSSSEDDMAARREKYGGCIEAFERIKAAPLSPHEIDRITELVDEYGGEWVQDALKVTGDAGKCKINFTEGVLRNWRTNGRERGRQDDNRDENRDDRVARALKIMEEAEKRAKVRGY